MVPVLSSLIDAARFTSFSAKKIATAEICMSAYGISANAFENYPQMGESTAKKCLRKFATDVDCFSSTYFRRPSSKVTMISFQQT